VASDESRLSRAGADHSGADGSGPANESVPKLVSELWDLVLAYLRQETLQPMRGLARFVVLGVPGALLASIGLAVLLLGALRLLQVHTGSTFGGNMSALPYVITAATGVVVAAAAGAAIVSGRSRRPRG